MKAKTIVNIAVEAVIFIGTVIKVIRKRKR